MEVCYWQVIPCFFLYHPVSQILLALFRIFAGLVWEAQVWSCTLVPLRLVYSRLDCIPD